MYKDDCIELFFDPNGDGFYWGDTRDVQLGLSIDGAKETLRSWAWFQKVDPLETGDLRGIARKKEGGYVIEGALKWSFLNIKPQPTMEILFTSALYDADGSGNADAKYNMFFQTAKSKDDAKILGRMILSSVARC
ncbi:MAG: hypothetical protein EOM23_08515 [Candidatus Moranbacteria bacterium]|nr:hypothetical protein [Candidatus Moranbacteria bacterium]